MQTEFRYRGRQIRGAEIESVRQLIAAHPGLSRRRLSANLCQARNWVQANGQLRDMVARSLRLQLHQAGLIVLPTKRKSVPNNAARHRAPLLEPPVAVAPLECALAEVGPLEIRRVRRTPAEALFGRLLQTYHYLGYRRPVGEHLKYLVYGRGQPMACLAWSSAPRRLGPRDRFIGWSAPQRRAQLHLRAYNPRFLILPATLAAILSGPARPKAKGHGRKGAKDYPAAQRVQVSHPQHKAGDLCPKCRKAKLYLFTTPARLVRIVAQPIFQAPVFELERLRCALCGAFFTAPAPPEAGLGKDDPRVGTMLALLRYGAGRPMDRTGKGQNHFRNMPGRI